MVLVMAKSAGRTLMFRLCAMLITGVMISSVSAMLTVPPTLGTHDPSRVIEDNGAYYFYSTSNDISGWYTTDNGTTWKSTGTILKNGIPAEVVAVSPANDGHDVWAPDVIYNPNSKLFLMYYSVAAWGKGTYNAIGLVTSPTLNPATAVWKDMGVVIARTLTLTTIAAIDPCPFFDAQGNLWLDFGTGGHGTALDIIPLDKMTGLRSNTSKTIYPTVTTNSEASAIYLHGDYYYLFWNTGGCCDGAASTYTIHMSRATNVTGPYTGAQVFLASTSTRHGPGQIGFITIDGIEYYSYHYYPNTGQSVLGFEPLYWANDWPKPNPPT